MAFNTLADNYVRAFTVAATVVAAQDTDSDTVKDVAATIGKLAEVLYKQQNKFVEKNDLAEAAQAGMTASPKSSPRSSGSASGQSGLSPKQRSALGKALDSLGDDAPYTIEQIEGLDASGGQNSERSMAIGETFDAAWGGK